MSILDGLKTVDEVMLELELAGNPSDFLIDGLVTSSATTIFGDAYVGKTFMAIDIAESLTTGKPFLGHPINREVKRAAFLMTDPCGRIEVARRVHERGLDGRRILTMPFFTPDDFAGWKEATNDLRREDIDLIIVDNTTDLADDTNGPREVKRILDGLRYWIDNSGAVVVNLHHNNKGGSLFGSIMWRKWTRLELNLSGAVKRPTRKLKTQSNSSEPLEFALRFDWNGAPAFTSTSEKSGALPEFIPKTNPRDTEIARWIVDNCQGLGVRETGAKAAAEFDGKPGTYAGYLSGEGKKYGALLIREGTTWTLRV